MCNPEIRRQEAQHFELIIHFHFLFLPNHRPPLLQLFSCLICWRIPPSCLTLHWWSDLPHRPAQSDLQKRLVKSEKRRKGVCPMNVPHRYISSAFKANTSRLITQDFPNTAQLSESLNHTLCTTLEGSSHSYQKITTFLMVSQQMER